MELGPAAAYPADFNMFVCDAIVDLHPGTRSLRTYRARSPPPTRSIPETRRRHHRSDSARMSSHAPTVRRLRDPPSHRPARETDAAAIASTASDRRRHRQTRRRPPHSPAPPSHPSR